MKLFGFFDLDQPWTLEHWRTVQALLLALVLVHALLGLRAIVLDFGLPVRWHRLLLVIAVALAAVIFAAVWGWRWS